MTSNKTSMRWLATAGAIGLLAMTGPANAGEKTPLSSLPKLPTVKDATSPTKDGVPGLVLKERTSGGHVYRELSAAMRQGYCIANAQNGLSLTSSTTLASRSAAPDAEDELWRLTTTDGKTSLERTRFAATADSSKIWVKSRASVEVRPVAKTDAVTVWGYREPSGDVILLARGVEGGRESARATKRDEEISVDFVSSSCSFGATRIRAGATRTGGVAQLRGSLPPIGEGKSKTTPHFVIDGSLAKVARDPEPLLAVRVRLVED